LSEEDLCLAEACGLLHDIGRFEQYSKYRTFADYKSENHAILGVKIIRDNGVLDCLEPAAANIVVCAVGCHNMASLPEGESERCLFFLKLLRDADKIDIWRVVTEHYRDAGDNRNRTVELDLPDIDGISAPVYKALMDGKLVQMADLRTLQDFKLLQIGWVYDLNFTRAFHIVQERKFLKAIRNTLPRDSLLVTNVYERACAHLKRNAAVR